MARSAPISIRLDPKTQRELEQMSVSTGIPVSALARMAIEAALKTYHDNGDRIEVPFRFQTFRYPTDSAPPAQFAAEERPTE